MSIHLFRATLWLLLLIPGFTQAQNNLQLLTKPWKIIKASHPGNEAQLYTATQAQKDAYYRQVKQMTKGAYLTIRPNNTYTFFFNQRSESGTWRLIGGSVLATSSPNGQAQAVIQQLTSQKLVILLQDGTILSCAPKGWQKAKRDVGNPGQVKQLVARTWKAVAIRNGAMEAKLMSATAQQKSTYYQRLQQMMNNSRFELRTDGTYFLRLAAQQEEGTWSMVGKTILVTQSNQGKADRSIITKISTTEMELMTSDGSKMSLIPIDGGSIVNNNNTPITPKPPKVKPKTTTQDKTPPSITVTTPRVVTRGFEIVHADKTITVKGIASDASGIFEVKVNGVEASIQANGAFSATIKLAVGKNSIQVEATDTKNNTAKVDFVIERKATTTAKKKVELVDDDFDFDIKKLAKTGKYYALFIAVEQYADPAINDLDKPVKDAQKLLGALLSHYTFSQSNITFLKNPKREDIIASLDKLQQTITNKDNLLIFYAGHGHWNSNTNTGYWLPSDAKKTNTANWFRNSTLKDYIAGIPSKHTLLIADACFSGGIFKTRNAFSDASQAINKLYELPSRKAMTSGNLQTVPDRSVFLEYLIKRLTSNGKKYISSEQLFSSFRTAVMNNSKNTPRYGDIQNAGDEGGDFIFIRKKQ
ncbi:hypothetical protein BKI52_15005 [marine bacterium AO1-C]|nr:hypothetical protein BKI52_15005 [marine bacterium AO1-C]